MLSRQDLTADELIERGIAPIHRQYIRASAPRVHVEAVTSIATRAHDADGANKRKSKSQNKRVRAHR